MSKSKIYRIFKELTNETIKHYCTNYMLGYVSFLLKNSNMSVGEICTFIGYKNYSSFLNIFKSHFNMTCGEYRKLYLKDSNSGLPFDFPIRTQTVPEKYYILFLSNIDELTNNPKNVLNILKTKALALDAESTNHMSFFVIYEIMNYNLCVLLEIKPTKTTDLSKCLTISKRKYCVLTYKGTIQDIYDNIIINTNWRSFNSNGLHFGHSFHLTNLLNIFDISDPHSLISEIYIPLHESPK